MFQGGWQILIFCFRLKWKAEDFSIDTCKCPGPIFCMNNSTVAGEPLRANTLFSTIAGKSQNLSDVRSGPEHVNSIGSPTIRRIPITVQ